MIFELKKGNASSEVLNLILLGKYYLSIDFIIVLLHLQTSIYQPLPVPLQRKCQSVSSIEKMDGVLTTNIGHGAFILEDNCYDFEQLSDNCLYLCLVLGKLSIVYSCLLGSKFNLSSSTECHLLVVLSKRFESEVVQ